MADISMASVFITVAGYLINVSFNNKTNNGTEQLFYWN